MNRNTKPYTVRYGRDIVVIQIEPPPPPPKKGGPFSVKALLAALFVGLCVQVIVDDEVRAEVRAAASGAYAEGTAWLQDTWTQLNEPVEAKSADTKPTS